MLISEFARATGLSPETVRYYVRRNLLRPQLSTKGGRNPYQLFTDADVRIAGLIRLGQALGWYAPGQGAGLIGAIVGAVIVLFVWGMVVKQRATGV